MFTANSETFNTWAFSSFCVFNNLFYNRYPFIKNPPFIIKLPEYLRVFSFLLLTGSFHNFGFTTIGYIIVKLFNKYGPTCLYQIVFTKY